jgi:hypothetical protein
MKKKATRRLTVKDKEVSSKKSKSVKGGLLTSVIKSIGEMRGIGAGSRSGL